MDDAAEWQKPYPEPVKPVTLEELIDFLSDEDMIEGLEYLHEPEVTVDEVLRRMKAAQE